MSERVKLQLLPKGEYVGVNRFDPIRFYYWPVLGGMYRRRVELCLGECRGGQRVLEIGFGSGLAFLNLHAMYKEIFGLDLTADAKGVQAAFEKRGIATKLSGGNVLAMPYEGGFFDTVMLISILEHLKPGEQAAAFGEIRRVLKPGGQVVYGVPVERRLMVWGFRCLGYDIREHHFSTHEDVSRAAGAGLKRVAVRELGAAGGLLGSVYEVGHFVKE